MIALLGAVADVLFGTWVAGVRLLPAIAGALSLWVTTRMVAELGGGRWGQLLAGLGYLVGVINLRVNVLFQPVSFDLLAYAIAAWLLIRILQHQRPTDWLLLGLTIGLGLLTKYTMLLFVGGAFLGLVLTDQRRQLATPWPWLAALVSLVIWSPNLHWQWQQGFPVVEPMAVLAQRQLDHVDPITFLLSQLLVSLSAAPIWLYGLYWYLRSPSARKLRSIGWLYLGNLAVLLLFSGKIYYLAPAYPMLLAAGALAIEWHLERRQARQLMVAMPILVVIGSLGTIPISIPILSVNDTISYSRFGAQYLGMGSALAWEDGTRQELPQDFADMLGWEEQAQAVARVYGEIGSADVAAMNYGQAGALVRYGSDLGLPPVISKGSSFWLWGYGDATGDQMVILGAEAQDLQPFFEKVEVRSRVEHPHARETDVPIAVVSGPRHSMAELWQILKAHRY